MMMQQNDTGTMPMIDAPRGGIAGVRASVTVSFGAFPNGRAHTAG